MDPSYDVVTVGRAGVDIHPLQVGLGLEDVSAFGTFLGGTAADVAVAAARHALSTLEGCARAVTGLSGHGLMAMVEPFMSHRVDGQVRNDPLLYPPDGDVAAAVDVAAGLVRGRAAA